MRPPLLAALAVAVALASVAGPPAARADTRADVEAFVRGHLAQVGAKDLQPTMLPKAPLHAPNGSIDASYSADQTGSWFFDNNADDLAWKIDSLTLVVDEATRVAWYHGKVTARGRIFVDEGRSGKHTESYRVSGIVVDDHGWKVAVEAFTRPRPDRQLLELARLRTPPTPPATGAPKLTGDAKLAAAAAAWFPAALTASAADRPDVVASGTAPAEYGAGPAAAKLARSWDKLKLGAVTIDAHAWGSIGFVRAEVRMPLKGAKPIAAELVLHAIAVKDGDSWRWVSLNWAG